MQIKLREGADSYWNKNGKDSRNTFFDCLERGAFQGEGPADACASIKEGAPEEEKPGAFVLMFFKY